MILRNAQIEINAEGFHDCFIFHVKIPHPIHQKYAERLMDEVEKVIQGFARTIEKPEFWELED